MTLYDAPGELLGRVSEVVSSAVYSSQEHRELEEAALVARRVAAMWPHVFNSLTQENEILTSTLTSVCRTIDDAGAAPPEWSGNVKASDPLERYHALLEALNCLTAWLQNIRREPWARQARQIVRHGLAASAEAQGVMVEAAFGTTDSRKQ